MRLLVKLFNRGYWNESGGEGGAGGAAATDDSSTVLTGAKPDAGGDNPGGEGSPDGDKGDKSNSSEGGEGGTEGKNKGTDDKAGTEGSEAQPDTYSDFNLPEGMTVDAKAIEQATPVFKELGLNQEQAQKVVDTYAKLVQESSQQQINDFNQLKADWREESSKDAEIGGDKFNENIGVAKQALDKFGTPELKQLMDDYGIGNHPEVIRLMVRVGKTIVEDDPGSEGGQTQGTPDRVEMMYGKQ